MQRAWQVSVRSVCLYLKDMRRFFTAIIILCAAASFAAARSNAPRSLGFRTGVSGFDATYQHSFKRNQFLQGDFGVDFGYNANGRPGVRATAVYNFIWARPAWTTRGSWSLYAGPGLTLGYVNDNLHYRIGSEVIPYNDNGFMLALAVQVGLEYNFDFPLTLAAEVRPAFGMHANGEVTIAGQNYSKVGFYDNGMLGFVPTVAVRYKF
jgi:opacity protein-like surface antigen